METELTYQLTSQTGATIEGTAKGTLDEKYLTLTVEFGEPLLYAYTDITAINDADYQISLQLAGSQTLTLSRLGYEYENFLLQLFRLRSEHLLKLLLMDEKLLKAGYTAQYKHLNQQGKPIQQGTCEVRIYETALIFLPQKSDPIRQPYGYIQQVTKQDYKLTVANESGEKMELTQLGANFDPLAKALSDAMNALTRRSQEVVKALVPEADPITVNKLSTMLKDGKAAKRKDIEAVAPFFWRRLTKQVQEAGLTQEYGVLEVAAQKENICVGVKQGLMGDLTGSYVWLLFPLRDAEQGRLQNAVAMEAFTTGDDAAAPQKEQSTQAPNPEETDAESPTGGKATYFFKIMKRDTYAKASDEEVAAALENFLWNVNHCMTDINFRREPIYLSKAALDSPKNGVYRYAIVKLTSLQTLRSQFIGRVIHSSFEQWRGDVASLLNFNSHSTSDLEKWKRGTE
jgi:hypothetical protein